MATRLPIFSKSQSLVELTTAMMTCYKRIVGATTSPSDEDLPRLPLQIVQVVKVS
jgi:hypothetical protein